MHFAIRDEQYEEKLIKAFYGWEEPQELGVLDRVLMIYTVCVKSNNMWLPLPEAIPLKMNRLQETSRSLRSFRHALYHGLDQEILDFALTPQKVVRQGRVVDAYIYYELKPRQRGRIFGFRGHETVRVSAWQSNGLLLVHCYDGSSGQLIKKAIVSVRQEAGWQPLLKPRVVYTQGERSIQRWRLQKKGTAPAADQWAWEIANENMQFARLMAKRYLNRGLPYEDLISIGRIGLFNAAVSRWKSSSCAAKPWMRSCRRCCRWLSRAGR
jgi:hypothetical protein